METPSLTNMFDFSEYYDWVAKQMPNECRVVEIGNANGDSALYLCDKLHKLGKAFKMYMVDNMDYGGMNQLNELWRNVADSGWHRQIEIIPKDSREAAKMFNGESIDFCFLDSSHEFQETKESILAWFPAIKHEGYMGGHDFYLYPQVRAAVEEVVPDFQTRDEIPDQQTFQPERILHIIPTAKEYGVWSFQKRFWLKLNEI